MSKNNTVIKVNHINKTFKLPHEKSNSIKSVFVSFHKRKKSFEKQQALKDISFEVKEGEFFGIVGRNGGGKSTLLKILAGIYEPDSGSVQVAGRLTPFIELGVGFNHELTGRENVFLNGALLGFSRQEMNAMYKDIVEFAELERFMDQKLKNYSSGMQVRLAFSIAIRVQSDILLIDEVLAVGDANFQRKCIDVFTKLKAQGKTIIFISHDMDSVRRFCDRAIMLQEGRLVDEGRPDDIASRYEVANINPEETVENINERIGKSDNKIIKQLKLKNSQGAATNNFVSGEMVRLEIELDKVKHAKNIGVAIYGADGGYVFGTNTIIDDYTIGERTVYEFKADLGVGRYKLKLGIFGATGSEVYEFFDDGPSFIIKKGKVAQEWQGSTYIEHNWSDK